MPSLGVRKRQRLRGDTAVRGTWPEALAERGSTRSTVALLADSEGGVCRRLTKTAPLERLEYACVAARCDANSNCDFYGNGRLSRVSGPPTWHLGPMTSHGACDFRTRLRGLQVYLNLRRPHPSVTVVQPQGRYRFSVESRIGACFY